MKVFDSIREFFWPLLEGVEKKQECDIDESQITNWEERYKMLQQVNLREDDRLRSVESKSAIFIGTMSVATSIIVASLSFVKNAEESGRNLSILYLISFILVIYLLRTLWFSVKAQKRGVYSVISIQDICQSDANTNDYYKLLSQRLIKAILNNRWTVNRKVDSMVMAQEYFKRAICTMGVYAICVVFVFIDSNRLVDIYNWVLHIPLNTFSEICQWILICISLLLSILTFIRK